MNKMESFEWQQFKKSLKHCLSQLKKPGMPTPTNYVDFGQQVFTFGWNSQREFTRTVLEVVCAWNVKVAIVKERKKK